MAVQSACNCFLGQALSDKVCKHYEDLYAILNKTTRKNKNYEHNARARRGQTSSASAMADAKESTSKGSTPSTAPTVCGHESVIQKFANP